MLIQMMSCVLERGGLASTVRPGQHLPATATAARCMSQQAALHSQRKTSCLVLAMLCGVFPPVGRTASHASKLKPSAHLH